MEGQHKERAQIRGNSFSLHAACVAKDSALLAFSSRSSRGRNQGRYATAHPARPIA